MKLTGNTILITGGTSGIGYELGLRLLSKGNKVILLGRNTEKLRIASNEGFETIECDLANQDSVEQAAIAVTNNYPNINVLFNNAGIQNNQLFTETIIPLNKIHHEFEVNVTGQITLTHLLIPLLSTSDRSYIINTTSGLGIFPKEDALVYSAAKAAMRNFTQGLRYSLKKTSIKVLEFMPPVTDTAMTHGRDEKKLPIDELVDIMLPQLKHDRKLITVPKLRLFRWIAFLMPRLAFRIVSGK